MIVAYKRSWSDIFVEHSGFFTKKEKRSKKERKQRPVETGAAMEIKKGGFRRFFLDDFHRCLEKPTLKTLWLFHSYHRPGGDSQLTDIIHLRVSSMGCSPLSRL